MDMDGLAKQKGTLVANNLHMLAGTCLLNGFAFTGFYKCLLYDERDKELCRDFQAKKRGVA